MLEPFVDTNLLISDKNLNEVNNAITRSDLPSYTLPTNYTISGVIQYLQHEWNKFETERAQWENEKFELKNKIANLQNDIAIEKSLRNNSDLKISAMEIQIKEEKIKYHKLKFGEDSSLPEELENISTNISTNNSNENVREFLFPIEQVDDNLKKKLLNTSYELTRDELNKLVKIIFDKMCSLNVLYFRHQDYANAAKSILVSYPHLAKFENISERIIREKLRARFSAFRSREKQMNPEVLEAREKYTPSSYKRKAKVSEDSSPNGSGDEGDSPSQKKQLVKTKNNEKSYDKTLSTLETPSTPKTRSATRSSITIQKIIDNSSPTIAENSITIPANSLIDYQSQPTIRVSESILKIINEENEIKKKSSIENVE